MLKRNAALEVSRFLEMTRPEKISLIGHGSNDARGNCGGRSLPIYDVASWLLCGRAL